MRRVLIWIGGLLAAGYLAAGLFLYIAQDALLYHPEVTRVPASETNFTIRNGSATLRGWVLNPGHPGAVVYYGGNGDAVQLNGALFARLFPDRTVYLLAYRGYGASDGRPSEAAIFSDSLAFYDAVRARHTSVAILGRSLGSGVAVYVAAHRAAEKLAIVTPYDSIARVGQHDFPIFPVSLLLRDKFESWRYAPAVRCRVLVMVASDDQLVPRANTDALLGDFAVRPTVVIVPHTDHITIGARSLYQQSLAAFLKGDARARAGG